MHLKVLSPLSTHVPLLTQGSLEQGSKPSKYIIKVKGPPSKLELTTKPLMRDDKLCLRPNFHINYESGFLEVEF